MSAEPGRGRGQVVRAWGVLGLLGFTTPDVQGSCEVKGNVPANERQSTVAMCALPEVRGGPLCSVHSEMLGRGIYEAL